MWLEEALYIVSIFYIMWFEMAFYFVSVLYLIWFLFIFLLLCAYYFLALVKSPRKQAKPASTDETGCSSSGASVSTFRATPSIITRTEDDIDFGLSCAGVYSANSYPPSKAPKCQYITLADKSSISDDIYPHEI
jgi:Ca2+/Na+ antiporter